MVEVVWTEPALGDLDAIADFIALENPDGARDLVLRVFRHVEQLIAHPESGSKPRELKSWRYRQIVEPPCRVFYRYDRQRRKGVRRSRHERREASAEAPAFAAREAGSKADLNVRAPRQQPERPVRRSARASSCRVLGHGGRGRLWRAAIGDATRRLPHSGVSDHSFRISDRSSGTSASLLTFDTFRP